MIIEDTINGCKFSYDSETKILTIDELNEYGGHEFHIQGIRSIILYLSFIEKTIQE